MGLEGRARVGQGLILCDHPSGKRGFEEIPRLGHGDPSRLFHPYIQGGASSAQRRSYHLTTMYHEMDMLFFLPETLLKRVFFTM